MTENPATRNLRHEGGLRALAQQLAAEPSRSERVRSGLQVEFGWGGVRVDDATWDDSAVYDRLSTWGHRPPAPAPAPAAPEA